MISMWDITMPDRTEQRMEILRGHGKAVSSLVFAGNRVLVSGSEEGKICTWRLASSGRTSVNQWSQWGVFERHMGSVLSVAIDSWGLIGASGGEDGTVQIWELLSGRCTEKLQVHNGPIHGVSFSRSGTLLAIGLGPSKDMTWEGPNYAPSQVPGQESMVRIWDISGSKWGETSGAYTVPMCTGSSVQFHPRDECVMLVLDDRHTLHFLRYGGSAVPIAPTIEIGRVEGVMAASFAYEGEKVVIYGLDGHIKTLNTDNLPRPRYMPHHTKKVTGLAADPLGLLVASSSDDGRVILWDAGTGRGVVSLNGHEQGQANGTYAVVFSADGQLLACGSEDGSVLIWKKDEGPDPWRRQRGHTKRVMLLTFGRGGEVIASGSLDLTIRVWNPGTGVCTWTLNIWDLFEHTVPDRLRFADDDSTLELVGRDGSKRVWTIIQDQFSIPPCNTIRLMDFPASGSLSEQG
jgi:WD40 repeat protein